MGSKIRLPTPDSGLGGGAPLSVILKLKESAVKTRVVSTLTAVVVLSLGFAVPSKAAVVGLEMLLLVDVSGSIDPTEYALQKEGYVAAFRDLEIQSRIANTPGGVAVAYSEWSSYDQQSLLVPWTLLTDPASAAAFADSIEATTRAFVFSATATGDALLWGTSLLAEDNGFEGERLVIDISGDGEQSHARPPANRFDPAYTLNASIAAHAAGITVNGLAIGLGAGDLPGWYEAYIVGPGGGTLYTASDFLDFQDAIGIKIGTEIGTPGDGAQPVPEPATLVLLGGGLLGVALSRSRRA